MSVSFGSKKESKTQNTSQQTDPWDETIPYLRDFMTTLDRVGSRDPGPSTNQLDAADRLTNLGFAGNPNSGDVQRLADDLFSTQSRAGAVQAGYDDLERRLTPTADGTNLNILNNPHLQGLLQRAGDDVAGRINAQFAGAGRDLSGYNQRAIGEGVAGAQLPILFDQFNREQGRTDAAARDLFGAKTGSITTQDILDRQATDQRARGIDAQKARMDMDAWGPKMVFDLEQQMKKLPYEDLSYMAELLFPVAGLGSQSTGTSVTKGKSQGVGFQGNLYQPK